ncbi:glycerophosphodiester phosphodiesterase GDPDL3 [Neltuma alba]|uniref:glycerophosphodiester phosphodiesterase GDPDL3 n=1 Tax=Neltuma alba TaxID=207710 RepID=UPI0010A57EE7|nr:glycerophosphodiester phosphodiesterase GDPDL3-like [Prosopis alba]
MWWNLRTRSPLLALLILYSLIALVSSSGPAWKTLKGSPPLVVARGGFSGIFPDSSDAAYKWALNKSASNVVLWCDLQLTKDGAGICFPDLKLNNATNIANVYLNKTRVYNVNGFPTRGWFTVDYNLSELAPVSLVQGVYSRTDRFDRNKFRILTVEDVAKLAKPQGLWLNVQNDAFFKERNLSINGFLNSLSSRQVSVGYISSPDVGFLREIMSAKSYRTTRIIFRFLNQNEVEPTTNQTYGTLLKNLKLVKTFASGILVPKDYIWPTDPNLYLEPSTSVVADAHREGLQVFVSNVINDLLLSYNYSYDPLAECLSFIDNNVSSVDGVLSDFPTTPSAAINCFSGIGENATRKVDTRVITKYGASGDYPPCTDLAYKKAMSDGADVLDCPVQMSKDGIPFCLSSIDLTESTTAAETSFSSRATTIPEIKTGSGIFTFSLTWDEIKTLRPSMLNPYSKYTLFRNPKAKNAGTFVTLSDFLTLTKDPKYGILVSIENAAYLAERQGLNVIDAVHDALNKAGYDKPGPQKVMIQSTHSSVLMKFKENPNYERVYKIKENIYDALDSTVKDIKTFADSVVVKKFSVFPEVSAFLVNSTKTVSKLQSFNLSVYVETFSNEFVSQAWDYYSDAFVEINSFVIGAKVNGIITDFPKTADRYRKNLCLNLGDKTPPYMSPIEPGRLLQQVSQAYLPPPAPPLPVLNDTSVADPPLSAVSGFRTAAPAHAPAPAAASG